MAVKTKFLYLLIKMSLKYQFWGDHKDLQDIGPGAIISPKNPYPGYCIV
jgi:hypothetical protein